jgi:hypothetical protein
MDFSKKAVRPMSMNRLGSLETPDVHGIFQGHDAIVEVSLLLPDWEAAALERLACSRGLTVGQVLRSLVWNLLAGPAGLPNRDGDEKALEFRCVKRAAVLP